MSIFHFVMFNFYYNYNSFLSFGHLNIIFSMYLRNVKRISHYIKQDSQGLKIQEEGGPRCFSINIVWGGFWELFFEGGPGGYTFFTFLFTSFGNILEVGPTLSPLYPPSTPFTPLCEYMIETLTLPTFKWECLALTDIDFNFYKRKRKLL